LVLGPRVRAILRIARDFGRRRRSGTRPGRHRRGNEKAHPGSSTPSRARPMLVAHAPRYLKIRRAAERDPHMISAIAILESETRWAMLVGSSTGPTVGPLSRLASAVYFSSFVLCVL